MSGSLTRWLLIGAVALAALGAGVYVSQKSLVGTPAPTAATGLMGLSLPDAGGKEQALQQWRGKVMVVNFWATWCAPCREEMPEFIKAQSEFGNQGLQFVGIAVDSADKVAQFAQEIGLNYPTLVGGFGAMELSKTLGNTVMALPFTVVVDRQGAIVHTQLGVLKPEKLHSVVKGLL
jgi:thiol-disulfide isomerase/thioredoxin